MQVKKIYVLVLIAIILLFSIFGLFIKKHFASFLSVQQNIEQIFTTQTSTSTELFDLHLLPPIIDGIETASNSSIVLNLLPSEYLSIITEIAPFATDSKLFLESLLQKDQKWLLVFQNSDEIRATGGFIGSYAIVDIKNGKILSITTEDIYDADGQFTGFISAPAGVAEYLSSGNGLRLPDANWHPDTAQSAQQILQFFALGNKQEISGVVFINIEFAESLLDVVGEIELIDYNTIVTSENISEVLRSRRTDFFPGSIQKKHMLSQLLTQVRIKLLSLNPQQIPELLDLLAEHIQLHTIQLYAVDPKIDEILERNNLRQILPKDTMESYIYLVESNVGINKANKSVERKVSINFDQEQNITIIINFKNNNAPPKESKLTQLLPETAQMQEATSGAIVPESHLAYVNYQRILVPTSWKLVGIRNNGQEITDQNISVLPEFPHIQEIGTLVTIAEESESTLEIEFQTNQQELVESIYVQHQPGIPTTEYIITYNTQTTQKDIVKNTEIQF